MNSKLVNLALGQVAKSRIPQQSPPPSSDRRIAEQTYLSIMQTIEENDRWTQAEGRDVLTFRDHNGVIWFLAIINKHARLRLVLVLDASGVNLGWRSEELIVGWPIEKENGRFGFALTAEFSEFAKWRQGVMSVRPVTRRLVSSS